MELTFIEVPCPVCSGSDVRELYPDTLGNRPPVFGYKWTPDVAKTYRIVMCRRCGHGFCSPRLQNMYRHYTDVADQGYLKNAFLRRETAKRVLKTIRTLQPQGTLLDIGCSTGDFLVEANAHFTAEGIELSNWAADLAEAQQVRVHRKLISDFAPNNEERYDVVTLWGVIEHLESPMDEVKSIYTVLKKNGIVCFWTGDIDSIYSRILRARWWYILGQHVQYFSRTSLDHLMVNAGFSRVYGGNYPYVVSLGYLATRGISSFGPLFGKVIGQSFL